VRRLATARVARVTTALAFAAIVLAACAPRHRSPAPAAGGPPPEVAPGAAAAADAIAAASEAAPTAAWDRLAELTDLHGNRITGSAALAGAIAWAASRMRDDGLDDVRRDKVMVPHWVRGAEHARIVAPVTRDMALLGLGGSVGTRGTLRAPVAAFDDLDALKASTASLRGAIAFVNHRMPEFDEAHDDPGYLRGMQARLHAAAEAAKRGARAVLIRSVTATSLRTPHTGALQYENGVPKIPAAALSLEDADLLGRLAHRGRVEVELSLGARTLPDAPSANVIGELRGRALPDEIVVLGAHLDSWDVGQGASDDGAGCVAVMEAARLLRQAGLAPRRTVRVVLFTAEEYGLAGAKAYHEQHGAEHHVAAFETDYGMAAPDAIGVGGGDAGMQAMAPLLPLFGRFGIRRFQSRVYGSDVEALVKDGAVAFNLQPDGRHYFDIHHTEADTLDKVRPEDIRRNAAAIALLAWVIAER